jgi:hypothetical protein
MEDSPQGIIGTATRQLVSPPQPAAPPRVWWWRAELRRAAPALALFAAVRLTGVVMVAIWSLHLHRHPRNVLGLEWDGGWYWHIVRYGYGTIVHSPGSGRVYNDLAFFPLYPGLVRTVITVLPIGPVNAALVVSWVAAALAAWGVYAIGELLHGRRVGIALVALWALLPHAVVLTMAYTESLMTAFAAWSLYAALTHRWLTAGTLAALAGLCRPNGIAAGAAVSAAAAAYLWQRHRAGQPTVPRAWGAVLLAPAGWVGYVAWVGFKTHSPAGYFQVQSGWGSKFDFGHYTLFMLKHLILGHDSLVVYLTAGIAMGAVLLFLLGVLDRQPVALIVYSSLLIAMALGGAHFFTSRPRLLLPAFPLLLPLAVALARARPRTVAVLLTGLAGFSLFYGTYLLTISRRVL